MLIVVSGRAAEASAASAGRGSAEPGSDPAGQRPHDVGPGHREDQERRLHLQQDEPTARRKKVRTSLVFLRNLCLFDQKLEGFSKLGMH